jgi:hypothetical protein
MGPAADAEKRYKPRRLALRIVAHSTTRAGARRLGTVKHIRLNFIAPTASKDVVVQALAVVMGFNDSKSQIVPAYWTHHFRGNRARRLLSKHSTPPSRRFARRRLKTRHLRRESEKQELKRGPGRLAIPASP